MSSTIAVWSNKGTDVPFMSGKEPVVFRYGREEPCDGPQGNYTVVNYDPGCHRETLRQLRKHPEDASGEEGLFIQKHKTKWCKQGTIVYAQVPDMGNVQLYLRKEDATILATNKPDALRKLGFTKKMGKGTGTYMMGVCRIKPLN